MPTVRPAVKNAFVLACLATLAAAYFTNTPLPLFLTRLRQLGLAAVILWSAGGWGTRVLDVILSTSEGSRRGRPRQDSSASPQNDILSPLEKLIFSETLGLGALSTITVLLGAVHAWVPVGAWVMIGTGALGGKPFLENLRRLHPFNGEAWALPSHSFWAGAALAAGGVISFLLALAPITYYDSLVYHFALPAAYIHAGHWVALPHLIYSAFPQTLEMLWTLGLLAGDDTVANLIAWSLSALLLTAVIAYGKRFMDSPDDRRAAGHHGGLSVGVMAAALLAVMPAFLLLSSGGYVDVGLTLFSFMALYAASLSEIHPGPSSFILAGLCAGWAMGTKYTGGIPCLLIAGLLYVELRRTTVKERLKSVAIYAGSALVVFSPWLIKNTLYVGNPVFPFFYQWGVLEKSPWVNQAAANYFAGITEYYSRSVFELPRVVWEAAVNGIGFGRGIDVLGDFGWLPLIGFLPALWLCRKLSGTVKRLLAFSALFFIVWAMTRPVLRFLLPVSPLLALLVAYAWVHGVRTQANAVRWAARGFLASFLASGLFLFFYVAGMISFFPPAIGLEGKEAYLSRMVNYYSAAAFVNDQTPPDSLIYVVGDQRSYYYRRSISISPVFSRNPLMEWANDAANAKALRQKLKEEGVTHLLVNRAELERLKSYSTFNAQGKANWDRLPALLTPLYHDRACDVYAL